jgi:hypothetical protein
MQSSLNSAETLGEVSIKSYKWYKDIPLATLNQLPFSVYLIDYNWIYLFLNANSRSVFGELADKLIGKSALEIFSDSKFNTIFENVQSAVVNRSPCDCTLYSPLRGRQVNIKGYPLEDCYYFSTTILPGKEEVLADLREQLNKKE